MFKAYYGNGLIDEFGPNWTWKKMFRLVKWASQLQDTTASIYCGNHLIRRTGTFQN